MTRPRRRTPCRLPTPTHVRVGRDGGEYQQAGPDPPPATTQLPPHPTDGGTEHGPAPHGREHGPQPAASGVQPLYGKEILFEPLPLGVLAGEPGRQLGHPRRIRVGSRDGTQLTEEVLDDPDPQVVVAVVPRVERDLLKVDRERAPVAGDSVTQHSLLQQLSCGYHPTEHAMRRPAGR